LPLGEAARRLKASRPKQPVADTKPLREAFDTGAGPISGTASRAGNPIKVGDEASPGDAGQIAITPDGKTLYVACEGAVVPVSTATNTPGRPIRLARVPHGDRNHRAMTCTAARSWPGETPDRGLTPREQPGNPVR
jgi:hypothetical protein